MKERISFNELYLKIAFLISERAVDPHTKVGCVAVNDRNELIGASYNGFKAGYEPTFDIEKERDKKNLFVYHAEQNIILRHKRGGIHTLYLTHSCCGSCAKLVAGHGVKRVVYVKDYHREQHFKEIFTQYGVEFKQVEIKDWL